MSPRQDIITAVVAIILGGALFFALKDTPDRAAMVPRTTLTVFLVLTFVLLARGLAQIFAGIRVQDDKFFLDRRLFAAAATCFIGYTLLISPLGFYTASALFLGVLIPLLGYRRPIAIGLIIAGFLIGFWFVFEVIFDRVLPREFFQAFSNFSSLGLHYV